MRKIGSVVAVVAALVTAGPAAAQVSFDLKAGYGVPLGDSMKPFAAGFGDLGGAMNHTWSGAIPIEVAGRYRFSPGFSAGVYFQYAPALVAARACISGWNCTGFDVRVGVEAAYSFLPTRFLNPWVSVGTGWEWTNFSITTPDNSANVTFSGWEYFNVQVGLDFNLSRMFAVGPYVGYFGGSYSTVSGQWSGDPVGPSIPSDYRAFHGWVQFGAKGTLNL
jgi:hypothetical protein